MSEAKLDLEGADAEQMLYEALAAFTDPYEQADAMTDYNVIQ